MKTLTELILEYQDATNDDSVENKARAIRRMNQRQQLLAAKDHWWLEDTITILSQANVGIYDLPAKFKKFKELNITVGDLRYPLQPYHSERKYNEANMWGGVSVTDYVEGYTIQNNQLRLVPAPSNENIVLDGTYYKKPTIMRLEDYTTGTISVTYNTKTVTGSGTQWLNAANKVRKGSVIFLDDEPYEVASADSNTQITLYKKYEGSTLSGATYRVGDVPVLPDAFQDMLWIGEAMMYYMKKDKDQFAKYKLIYEELEEGLDGYASGQISSNVMAMRKRYFTNPNFNPRNIGL